MMVEILVNKAIRQKIIGNYCINKKLLSDTVRRFTEPPYDGSIFLHIHPILSVFLYFPAKRGRCLLSGILWLFLFPAYGQEEAKADMLYKKDGSTVACIIQDVLDQKIQYKTLENADGPVYNILKEDVVLAMKPSGQYLIPSNPAAQWVQASSPDIHKIITKEHQIIPATFVEIQGDKINYQENKSGEKSSLGKDELLAVIRKDGSNTLFAPADKVVAAFTQLGEMNTFSSTEVREKLKLDKNDYEMFTQKALQKAEDLGLYLTLLCSKQEDDFNKRKAEENALKLFIHDSTWVEVSSMYKKEKDRYRIRQYLQRIRLLDYDQIELTWRNIDYITKLRLGTDGRYYGIITVQQLFRGIKDNKVVYQDVTQKDIEVVLATYKREKEGKTETAWDVFLSDIGVQQTKAE